MQQLQALGQESIKKVLLKHDIKEPLYGVKIEELQKIRKQVKNGYALSLQLYDTGVYDARYLAGLVTEPEKMAAGDLQHWAVQANCHALRESTVAWVTAESRYGMEKAMEWIRSGDDALASTGWATLSNIVAITEDSALDIPLLRELLHEAATTIHDSANRVKLTKNSFVISVGTYIKGLNELAKQTAARIGKVTADMGDTACKIAPATEYIEKAEKRNSIGKKKKSARCL